MTEPTNPLRVSEFMDVKDAKANISSEKYEFTGIDRVKLLHRFCDNQG
jgi:hypothetical protein